VDIVHKEKEPKERWLFSILFSCLLPEAVAGDAESCNTSSPVSEGY